MLQNAIRNFLPSVTNPDQDKISLWADAYFEYEVTTSAASQKIQHRDIQRFINFIVQETGNDTRRLWTPRLSRSFLNYLQQAIGKDGKRRWNNRTVNTTLTHVKTFAKWITKISDDSRSLFAPFPTGNPMAKIKLISLSNGLEVERALTKQERDRILDSADQLLVIGGLRQDRNLGCPKIVFSA